MTGTAIAHQHPSFVTAPSARAIIPGDFDSVWEMSRLINASGMAPKDMKTTEQIAVALFHGLEIGLTPMAALQSIAVINGRPSVWGDGALGLVRGSGLCEYVKEWIEGDGDEMVAYCEVKRKSGETRKESFSVADAKLANLWGKTGPWTQYPRRMLAMRARAWALRDTFADVLRGLAIVEEQQDVPMKDVTPQPPAPPADDTREAASASAAKKPEPARAPPPAAEERRSTPPAPPAEEDGVEDAEVVVESPNESYIVEFDSAMAKASTLDELKAVWGTRRRDLGDEDSRRIAEVKDAHKLRIERETESSSAFDLGAFKGQITEALGKATSADQVQHLLDEVDGAVEAGSLSEADKEEHFTDLFSEAFERFG